MVKDENDVWTGELTIPKGTKFDIKILKSTVSTTSGGDNKWSAVRYASTLNLSASHDFGEFTDNLIPNGDFEEGYVKWTPAECIFKAVSPIDGEHALSVGGDKYPNSCTSDVFVIPPNQTLRFTGYVKTFTQGIDGVVTMKIVTPKQQTLFEFGVASEGTGLSNWLQFGRTFKTADVPIECQIVLSNVHGGSDYTSRVSFDSLSLVSP